MTFAFSLILTLYCAMLVAFLIGWVKVRRQTMPRRSESPPPVSVVVAVRNETQNIQNLIQLLTTQAFPKGRVEVILVNDHSTDETAALARRSAEGFSHVQILDLPEGKEGKKAALQYGIERATFEVIATTDADCTFSKNWLTCVSSYFELAENKMVLGVVKLSDGNSFFSQLQVTELVSLAGSTAASVGFNHPIMCNGANLTFRKSVFEEVGGYDDNMAIPSGDDEFLMRKIRARYPQGIRFLNYYEAVVSTPPQKTLGDLIQQRLRWAGKWKHNSDPLTKSLAVFILLAQVSFVAIFFGLVTGKWSAVALIVPKIFLEGVLIYWVGRFLDVRFDVPSFILLQIAYPFYVLGVGIVSLFSSYRWKGRNYR